MYQQVLIQAKVLYVSHTAQLSFTDAIQEEHMQCPIFDT